MKDKFTKNDLKNRMVVELRNGSRLMVIGDTLVGEVRVGKDSFIWLKDYNNDLTKVPCYKRFCDLSCNYYVAGESQDIIRVYQPQMKLGFDTMYDSDIVWERDCKKEMTIEEIENELGYKIKIVNKK